MDAVRAAARISLAIAGGSAVGAVCRALISLAFPVSFGAGLPWATLIANGLGSFLIGLIAAVGAPSGRWPLRAVGRHLWMTGFCGGFTTFSVFSLEAVALVHTGAAGMALGYAALSLGVWLGAVWLGAEAGTMVNRRIDRR
ncbi:fluoride efflux transporter FluC [Pelagibacterium halotolerans]|uniref:fluoride efflux transporter FluC n=1 Tax=Pelagibacterium halotolerans TaxID=531813 RepID=UPI00384F1AE0